MYQTMPISCWNSRNMKKKKKVEKSMGIPGSLYKKIVFAKCHLCLSPGFVGFSSTCKRPNMSFSIFHTHGYKALHSHCFSFVQPIHVHL